MNTPQLHHCTDFNSLCSILDSKAYWPSYCLEQSDFIKEFSEAAHAVVCFADLLPDEVERHLNNFKKDSYIVMSKEWASKNLISPVVYYTKDSIPSATMKHWTNFFIANQDRIDIKGREELLYKSTNLMFAYMKQYEGVYFDDNKDKFSEEKRVFYLEREWRWVPLVKKGEAYYLPKESFLDENIRRGKRQELINHGYTLKFTPEDVIKVGIPEEQVDAFKKKFGEKYKVKPL
jgi:hypothetical protein